MTDHSACSLSSLVCPSASLILAALLINQEVFLVGVRVAHRTCKRQYAKEGVKWHKKTSGETEERTPLY